MSRTYARIKVGIWHDDTFRALSSHSQHLYFTLLTDPDLSYCGIADWRPKRIAARAGAWMPEQVEMAACELLDNRMLFICEDTEEVLVRSFVRHDGVLQNAKLAVSAANAVGSIASNGLRGVVVSELIRAKKENPEWAAWKVDALGTVLKRDALDPSETDPFGPEFAPGLGRIWAMPENPFGPSSGSDLAHA